MSNYGFERDPAWRRSVDLVRVIHRFSRRMPAEEKSLLTAALKKTALGIPSRLADAHGRDDAAMQKARQDSLGALREIHTYLALAERLRYMTRFRTRGVRRAMARLQRKLTPRPAPPQITVQASPPAPKRVRPPRAAA